MSITNCQTNNHEPLQVCNRSETAYACNHVEHVSSKIQARHRERLAVVYVRQSSPHQVFEHRESKELQYRLAHRAVELGWSKERVLVIDEDQGQSACTADDRLGFQRLLAEVGLDHVGLVLGIEMSRLARCNKDWHQLLELCAMFGALLADQDGLYDPLNFNDRLLLGLKGTMSEAEVHILKARMVEGRRNKAKRGELFNDVPAGYILLPSGQVVLDPDEQVQAVVRLVFDKFEELGSAMAVLRYLVEHNIMLPAREKARAIRGQLVWRRPRHDRIIDMLHNPIYAGAYAHGRHQSGPRAGITGKMKIRSRLVPMEQWRVLYLDRLPAYITWERYLANQRQLAQNATRFSRLGPPREGPSFLGGLVHCGNCGHRMNIIYPGTDAVVRYTCNSNDRAGIPGVCQSVAGAVLEESIGRTVFQAMQPVALELSLRAAGDIQKERDRLHKHWLQRLERAHYEVERAKRQYNAVEPENRLVARELERRWEQSLVEERQLQDEYDRFRCAQPTTLSEQERTQILSLAADVPGLWNAPSTTAIDRQVIVRHLIERIVVTGHGKTEVIDVTIHWHGGFVSQHEVVKSVAKYEYLRDYDALKKRVIELRNAGRTAAEIAAALNAEGFRTPHRNNQYTDPLVRRFLVMICQSNRNHPNAARPAGVLKRHEWWLPELAGRLDVATARLRDWCRRGWVHAHQWPGPRHWWIVWANESELARLHKLRSFQIGPPEARCPPELIIPGPRTDD